MAEYKLTREQEMNMLAYKNRKLEKEIEKLNAERKRLHEVIKLLNEISDDNFNDCINLEESIADMRFDIEARRNYDMSEECLIGFNMAVAIMNKHLGKDEENEQKNKDTCEIENCVSGETVTQKS